MRPGADGYISGNGSRQGKGNTRRPASQAALSVPEHAMMRKNRASATSLEAAGRASRQRTEPFDQCLCAIDGGNLVLDIPQLFEGLFARVCAERQFCCFEVPI